MNAPAACPTPTETRLLDAIATHWERHGYAPSLRDLMDATGGSSTSVVHFRLVRMRRAGLIDFVDGNARTVHLKGGPA